MMLIRPTLRIYCLPQDGTVWFRRIFSEWPSHANFANGQHVVGGKLNRELERNS